MLAYKTVIGCFIFRLAKQGQTVMSVKPKVSANAVCLG